MNWINSYCANIQQLFEIDEIKVTMFTETYCDKNACFNCPLHPKDIIVKRKAVEEKE